MPESWWRNFLTRTELVQHWTDCCGRLTLLGLQTGSPASAENVSNLHKRRASVCENGDHLSCSCRLPFAIYLKSVWSLNVHEFSVDKLAHSDKDSEDD